MKEKLTESELNKCVLIEACNYDERKVVWVSSRREIFYISEMLNKPVLLLKRGTLKKGGVPFPDDKVYNVLFVLDGDRTYAYNLK